jgi:hypothetical protein
VDQAERYVQNSACRTIEKEKTMDRNYYYQKLAQEHQLEMSQELAARHMLKGLKREPLTMKQARHLILRIAPVAIVITILLLSLLG